MAQTPTSLADSVAAVIRERRSINRFKPDLPPRSTLLKALELACWAPNHHLSEPWRFYLLGEATRAAVIERNAELVAAAKGETAARVKRERWQAVPGYLLMTCERSADALRFQEDYAACCAAAQNIALYLWAEGIGMKWTTGEVTRDPRFYEMTWIDPDAESVVGLFWYGYPDEQPDGHRCALETRLVQLD